MANNLKLYYPGMLALGNSYDLVTDIDLSDCQLMSMKEIMELKNKIAQPNNHNNGHETKIPDIPCNFQCMEQIFNIALPMGTLCLL